MLDQRLRRWPSIETISSQRCLDAGKVSEKTNSSNCLLLKPPVTAVFLCPADIYGKVIFYHLEGVVFPVHLHLHGSGAECRFTKFNMSYFYYCIFYAKTNNIIINYKHYTVKYRCVDIFC